MKRKNLKQLQLRKSSISTLNSTLIKAGALPTTNQSTVIDVTKGEVCQVTEAICPTNWFDC